MKKIKLLFLTIIVSILFITLFSCGDSTDDTNNVNETKYVNIIVNADFTDNFKTNFSNSTYWNKNDNQTCVDVSIIKKSNFILRNTFLLKIVVTKEISLEGGSYTATYIDASFNISETNFNAGKYVINCPVMWTSQFDFTKTIYRKQFGVKSLG
ncbi:MAG: hypothetical protein K5892_02285 [Acholeplasmatales bacterium]|nr:hypothetical protein [Acholeplasmatales bacterium]